MFRNFYFAAWNLGYDTQNYIVLFLALNRYRVFWVLHSSVESPEETGNKLLWNIDNFNHIDIVPCPKDYSVYGHLWKPWDS
jgi:hypothetical protein